MPYAYNADENAHFVTRAIGLFGHGWDPQYYVNPPAYTYLAHLLLGAWYGGRSGVSNAFAADPTQIWVLTRVLAAVLGTLAIWLTYLAGSRLVDRRAGLLAAGIFTVAFLPVFYSKLALNDVPTLAPLCLALWGTAGILRLGRRRDYVIAGIGLGLACATKYTGGIVLLPLVAATIVQFTAPGGRSGAARGIAIAGGVALLAFVVANPYAILNWDAFVNGLTHQSDASGDAAGKLGLTQKNGFLYYLWSFGWGLGWIPLFFAVGGAVRLWFDERRLFWVLVPAVVLFVLFMGSQERYFGRWLMPVFPFVCVLAAYAAFELVDFSERYSSALKPTIIVATVVALCAQGFVYSLHSGLVLSKEDTRNLAREWMVANVPLGEKIVVEPVVPDLWAQDIGNPTPLTSNGYRWTKFPLSKSVIDPKTGSAVPRRPGAARQHRGLREGADTRSRLDVRAAEVLLGRRGIDAARAGGGAAGGRAARAGLLPRARVAVEGRARGLAVRQGRGAGGVQLRLDVRLLPARLHAARAGDDDLPPAGRALQADVDRSPRLARSHVCWRRVPAHCGRPRAP